jgi:hypothetical protein
LIYLSLLIADAAEVVEYCSLNDIINFSVKFGFRQFQENMQRSDEFIAHVIFIFYNYNIILLDWYSYLANVKALIIGLNMVLPI